jgi:hypothetical protein
MTDAISGMTGPVFACKILAFACSRLQNIVLGTVQNGIRQTTTTDTTEREFDDAATTAM